LRNYGKIRNKTASTVGLKQLFCEVIFS